MPIEEKLRKRISTGQRDHYTYEQKREILSLLTQIKEKTPEAAVILKSKYPKLKTATAQRWMSNTKMQADMERLMPSQLEQKIIYTTNKAKYIQTEAKLSHMVRRFTRMVLFRLFLTCFKFLHTLLSFSCTDTFVSNLLHESEPTVGRGRTLW